MKTFLRTTLFLLALVGIIAGAGAWYLNKRSNSSVVFRTTPIKRGDLVATIDAPGTLEPEEVIDVGAQVAGQIKSFGQDKNGKTIDYGSAVEEGTVLAQIDDSLYTADVAQASAQLKLAQAGVERAEADLGQMKAKLEQAKRDWERAQKLGPSDALAQSNYDAYKAAYDTAVANVAVGEAAIGQARSTVAQAEANLQRSQRNLSYCTIKSPVKGVIIDRRVNTGQTVVASLNAPSLFLLAKDLHRMQVWVAVNEADIGNIFPGQPVRFTVDAFPGQEFRGAVGKIRLNATMTQNVVTYTVEVQTDNASGKLLPYLTANVHFETKRRDDVLMVPTVALRWLPTPALVAPEFRSSALASGASGASGRGSGGGRGQGQGPAGQGRAGQRPTTNPSRGEAGQGTLWVQQGDYVRPIAV
ncbi:MAG: efflux RND transporter periplasmic adaptor subunit, partial [Bacillota bacterium]